MESLTKNKQSRETINGMVQKAFNGLKAIQITELTEGFFNVAYMIKLSDDREVILKIAPTKEARIMTYEKNIMLTEVETMRLVKEKTNVPVPEVFYYDNSHTVCESDYFFMSKLSGASFNSLMEQLDENDRRNINYQFGKLNAEINSISGEIFGYYGQHDRQGKDWFEVFLSMIEDAVKDAKALNVDNFVDIDSIRTLLSKHKTAFEEVKIPRLVHWDLWAGNVFVDKGQITGLIDFERCLWADELMEVAFRPEYYNEDFWNGYGAGKLTENQKIRAKWYDLYLYLVWSAEGAYREYEDNELYNYAKKRIAETIVAIKNL